MKRLSLQLFIERSNKIHNNAYDYSKVIYLNVDSKVEIICPEHGSFFQTAANHLTGRKCLNCSLIKYKNAFGGIITNRSNINKKSVITFITQAQKKHDYFYDYRKTEYNGSNVKVEIICPEHGSFFQTPHNHLKGTTCKDCFDQFRTKTLSLFIEEADRIHNNAYDYSKFKYIQNKTKGTIICKRHGEFLQSPNAHLKHGCKKCNNIGGYCKSWFSSEERKNRKAKLYLINFSDKEEDFFKIGITIGKRYGNICSKYKIRKILEIETTLYKAFETEQFLLNHIIGMCYNPVRFIKNGNTECFQATTTELQNIVNTIKEKLYDHR